MKNSRISKMNGMKYTAAALAVAALQSGLALADTTTTATAATAGAQTAATASASTFDKVSEKLLLNYWGYYQGAAVNDPGNAFAPKVDGTTDTSSAQVIENIVNAGTHLDKDTNLYVGIHSFYYPRGKADGDGNVEGSADIQMLDPAIVLTRANLINTGGLKLKGYFSVVPAMETADFMKPKHMLGSVALIEIATYDLPNSKLTLGLYGYVKGYVAGAETPENARTYRIIAAPNANYQLTETVAASLWIDALDIRRNGQTPFIAGMSLPGTWDVEPGINWDITPKISFNPSLNIYPNNMTLASTSIQAILTAKAF